MMLLAAPSLIGEVGTEPVEWVSEARYAWRMAQREREALMDYGPKFPLRPWLDRLHYLGYTTQDGWGGFGEVYAIEVTAREFYDWIDARPRTEWPMQPTKKTEAVTQRLRPGAAVLAVFCGVLLLRSAKPTIAPTEEPA